MMITDYGTWYRENERRAADGRAFHAQVGYREPYDEPELDRLAHRADLMRCSDGAIHPWWACTDPKIRERWLKLAREAA